MSLRFSRLFASFLKFRALVGFEASTLFEVANLAVKLFQLRVHAARILYKSRRPEGMAKNSVSPMLQGRTEEYRKGAGLPFRVQASYQSGSFFEGFLQGSNCFLAFNVQVDQMVLGLFMCGVEGNNLENKVVNDSFSQGINVTTSVLGLVSTEDNHCVPSRWRESYLEQTGPQVEETPSSTSTPWPCRPGADQREVACPAWL